MRTIVTLRCLSCGTEKPWAVVPGGALEKCVVGEVVPVLCRRRDDEPAGSPGGCETNRQKVLSVNE